VPLAVEFGLKSSRENNEGPSPGQEAARNALELQQIGYEPLGVRV